MSTKNKARIGVSKVIREKVADALTELKNCQNGMFGLGQGLKTDSMEVEGGKCMRESIVDRSNFCWGPQTYKFENP